jgi:hypothetical protein
MRGIDKKPRLRRKVERSIMVAILAEMYGIAPDSIYRLIRKGDIIEGDTMAKHAANAQTYRIAMATKAPPVAECIARAKANGWLRASVFCRKSGISYFRLQSGVKLGLIAEQSVFGCHRVYKPVFQLMADADALAATKAKIDADPVAFLRSLGCGGAA